MKMPFVPARLGLFLFAIAFLFAVVQFGIVSIAFDKLGLSQDLAIGLLLLSLTGSVINIPVATYESDAVPPDQSTATGFGLLKPPTQAFTGKTTIAINIGGCVMPVLFSIYLVVLYKLSLPSLLTAVLFVTLIARFASTPIPGIGIGMPILVAPLAAAVVGLLLGGDDSAAMAYVSGTLGVLIGADILRLKDIIRLAVPLASIGGAGTFDGIFITGIVAVLLT